MTDRARTILVIPDLHGRADALEAALRVGGFVAANGRPRRSALWLVQLGDLLDRGPHPRACVDRLRQLQKAAPGRVHVLKGNHEALALAAPGDPVAQRTRFANGAAATLRDYEGSHLLEPGHAHYRWLEALPLSLNVHGVLFCHAGLARARRGVVDPHGLLWDRPPLTREPYRAVVCGHTPTASGGIEIKDGVYRCDVGLGHRPLSRFPLLSLTVGPQRLEHEMITVDV